MSQLSLYDFLSFFLPGFVAAELLRLAVGRPVPTIHLSDTEQTLLLLALSLLLGLFIHRLSAALFSWWRIAGRVLKTPIHKIVTTGADLKVILPALDEHCRAALGLQFRDAEDEFFDYAYFFLEANGRIAPAKSYQSLYFFCANFFTLALISLPVLCGLLIWHRATAGIAAFCICLLLPIAILAISISAARFCRHKMVVRIFWTYHILKKEPPL